MLFHRVVQRSRENEAKRKGCCDLVKTMFNSVGALGLFRNGPPRFPVKRKERRGRKVVKNGMKGDPFGCRKNSLFSRSESECAGRDKESKLSVRVCRLCSFFSLFLTFSVWEGRQGGKRGLQGSDGCGEDGAK